MGVLRSYRGMSFMYRQRAFSSPFSLDGAFYSHNLVSIVCSVLVLCSFCRFSLYAIRLFLLFLLEVAGLSKQRCGGAGGRANFSFSTFTSTFLHLFCFPPLHLYCLYTSILIIILLLFRRLFRAWNWFVGCVPPINL